MFDRRNSSSAPPPVVTQENVKATLKWFNPTKGFGFVATSDGAGDVFLHVSAVQGIDPNSLQPGVTLTVDLGQGRRGLQVVAVHEVDESTAEPEAPRKPRFGGGGGDRGYGGGQDRGYGGGQDRGYGGGQDRGYGGGQDRGYGGGRDRGYGGGQDSGGGSGEWVEGTMKFFNQQRGFGFVAPDGGGGQDVFLHLSALTRAQVATPADGQRVRYTTKQGRKGLEVDQIELA